MDSLFRVFFILACIGAVAGVGLSVAKFFGAGFSWWIVAVCFSAPVFFMLMLLWVWDQMSKM